MASRRFPRLTNGFSKKLDNHVAAVALYVAHYNLCRTHEGLRTTPTKALGVADKPWTVAQLVAAALNIAPALPTETPPDRRRKFVVIQGEKPEFDSTLGSCRVTIRATIRSPDGASTPRSGLPRIIWSPAGLSLSTDANCVIQTLGSRRLLSNGEHLWLKSHRLSLLRFTRSRHPRSKRLLAPPHGRLAR